MTTPYVSSILIDDVINALISFLQPFVGAVAGTPPTGTPIIRAQVNRVPSPIPAYVQLNDMLQEDLDTPSFNYDGTADVQQLTISASKKITIQIDFYGPSAGDWCTAVKTVYRSPYAPAQFPPGITSLTCSDGHQVPLITGEEQYENRYVLTADLEYNPAIAVPQQSATTLATDIFEDLP